MAEKEQRPDRQEQNGQRVNRRVAFDQCIADASQADEGDRLIEQPKEMNEQLVPQSNHGKSATGRYGLVPFTSRVEHHRY